MNKDYFDHKSYVADMENKKDNAIDLKGKTVDVFNGFFKSGMAVKNGTLVIKEDIDLNGLPGLGMFDCTVVGGWLDFANLMIRKLV